MKITMLKTMCGPQGNTFPGWVVDLPADHATLLMSDAVGAARKYEASRDSNNKRGIETQKSVTKKRKV